MPDGLKRQNSPCQGFALPEPLYRATALCLVSCNCWPFAFAYMPDPLLCSCTLAICGVSADAAHPGVAGPAGLPSLRFSRHTNSAPALAQLHFLPAHTQYTTRQRLRLTEIAPQLACPWTASGACACRPDGRTERQCATAAGACQFPAASLPYP